MDIVSKIRSEIENYEVLIHNNMLELKGRQGDSKLLDSLEDKEYLLGQSKWLAGISDKGLDMGNVLFEKASKSF